MGWTVRAFAVLLMLLAVPASAQAPRRVALVIGNAAYTTPGWALKNPVNDATLVAVRLRTLGFDVKEAPNASRVQMEDAMRTFGARLRSGGDEAIGVFYYAGHAVEHDGANLLIPVEVSAQTVDDLRYQAPPLSFVLRDMARAGNRVNIVILDACRNLPLPSGVRAGPAGGLGQLDDVPTNILLAYATRAGATAPDNPDETNSVFSRTLADALASNASDPLEVLFSNVQARVFAATGATQRPEFRSQLLRAPGFRLASAPEAQAPTRPAAPAATAGRAPGSEFDDCGGAGWCPRMIVVAGGSFAMGSPANEPSRSATEGPVHTVALASFAVGKVEITRAQWAACAAGGGCRSTPSPDTSGFAGDTLPVFNVSWDDAREYVDWLNARVPGRPYRLLSEAQWEYAARANSRGAYSFGPSPAPGRAVYNWTTSYNGSSTRRTKPDRPSSVGQFPANDFGLHDMHGNVFEWVEDCFAPSYAGAPADGSAFVPGGSCPQHVVRGGAWYSRAENTRAAFREPKPANWRNYGLGFRVARSLP